MRVLRRDVILASALFACASSNVAGAQEPCTRAWQRGLFGPDPAGWLFTAAVYDDGSGAALYGGGNFAAPAGQSVVRWDGGAWQAVGGGVDHVGGSYTEVHAMAVYGGELIAAALVARSASAAAGFSASLWIAAGSLVFGALLFGAMVRRYPARRG